MLRFIVPSITLLLALPLGVQAASLKDFELDKMLDKVAKQSSVGTPRAINDDILDQGYTVSGKELINHLSVRESHAVKMRANPDAVRFQLGKSVCLNNGYRQLLAKGAVMRYDFTEYKTNRPVTTERFTAADCGMTNPPKKK
ncbi:quorum-sensing-regulated virulence factor family protein [Pseudomonas sp. R5(2019)]|uniref:quorum-sensing-regulated virulence factor family protein n=1 Tax=Pseudomonas sp. R5(2019) TaxID=2697566 RepID=UPI0014132B81|nr:quorum-sensing-regulated virulence factor family protein [Pseudomonas sp. R5(2019)]NBA95350.1 hypothetical protein [Pseudomonas sp. R5(2019)]